MFLDVLKTTKTASTAGPQAWIWTRTSELRAPDIRRNGLEQRIMVYGEQQWDANSHCKRSTLPHAICTSLPETDNHQLIPFRKHNVT
jgi:hypothetical protein